MSPFSELVLAIDTELENQFAELSDPMLKVCRYATAGGRRTRAMLLIGGERGDLRRATLAATALEMIHAATLLQDDIFDGGDLRRGRPAAHLCFGKPLAILASDWLLICALELAGRVDPCFFRCLAKAGKAMAQAEALEFTPATMHSLEEAELYGCLIARGKTGALFGAAMCGAAVLQGVSADSYARWEQIGIEMGLTYQLVDDCVDLYGAEATAGKTLGHDLVAGCFTMPVLLAAHSLKERGATFSLADVQAGCLAMADLHRLQTEILSRHVMMQAHHLVQGRFARHRNEAQKAKLSPLALDAWQSDLCARLEPCFRSTFSASYESLDSEMRLLGSAIAWQEHA